jgi:hypothetical protein
MGCEELTMLGRGRDEEVGQKEEKRRRAKEIKARKKTEREITTS